MAGRPRKPTELRLLQGNKGKPAGHSRPVDPNEPKPVGALLDPPTHLSQAQRDIWAHAIANAPAGLLKRLDLRVLTAWTVAADLHQTATIEQNKLDAGNARPLLVQTRGPTKPDGTPGDPIGQPYQSPYLPIINKQALIMAKCCQELGFSPAARTRISLGAAPDKTADNDFDDV